MTTVKEILISALKEMGADGLYCPDESCGCAINDLVACDCDPSNCIPAKKIDIPKQWTEGYGGIGWFAPLEEEEDKDDEPEKPPQVATR